MLCYTNAKMYLTQRHNSAWILTSPMVKCPANVLEASTSYLATAPSLPVIEDIVSTGQINCTAKRTDCGTRKCPLALVSPAIYAADYAYIGVRLRRLVISIPAATLVNKYLIVIAY